MPDVTFSFTQDELDKYSEAILYNHNYSMYVATTTDDPPMTENQFVKWRTVRNMVEERRRYNRSMADIAAQHGMEDADATAETELGGIE